MSAVIIFIIILGVLVFVHELGHFLTARRNGIKAYEFGFGFPPRLIGFQKLTGKGVNRWRIIWGSKDGDDPEEIQDLNEADEKQLSGGTVYSLNWFPIGGFVKIKGEDGGHRDDPDSFSHKGAWPRIKVLAAGVMMNFVLAWILISIALMIGAPEASDAISGQAKDAKIQIASVNPGSPAESMGIKVGDEILPSQMDNGKSIILNNVSDIQNYINSKKGQEITLNIRRGSVDMTVTGTPRADAPQNQGALGITLVETAIVSYPWYLALWKGLEYTFNLIVGILVAFGGIIKSLLAGKGAGADISGPVGIAVLTKQVAGLGFVYILQFAAILSANLGIVNALPIPALDGGRILFVLIEKVKGSPVSQKVEQSFHTVFFMLLILLMVVVTFKDVAKFIK